jgi:hypothetical protein
MRRRRRRRRRMMLSIVKWNPDSRLLVNRNLKFKLMKILNIK